MAHGGHHHHPDPHPVTAVCLQPGTVLHLPDGRAVVESVGYARCATGGLLLMIRLVGREGVLRVPAGAQLTAAAPGT